MQINLIPVLQWHLLTTRMRRQTPLSLLDRLRTKGFGVLKEVLSNWKPWIPPQNGQVIFGCGRNCSDIMLAQSCGLTLYGMPYAGLPARRMP